MRGKKRWFFNIASQIFTKIGGKAKNKRNGERVAKSNSDVRIYYKFKL